MDNKKLKIDYKQLTPEQLSQLEQYNNAKAQLTKLEDIADMTHELINIFDAFIEDGGKTSNSYGALLMDMRDSLKALNDKEEPESPDFAKPVVSAVKALEQTLGLAIKGISIDAPEVNISAPSVDLKGVEKAIAQIPKAFAEAIKLIPKVEIPKTDNSALLKAWEGIATQLDSIDTATRMKPLPGSMKVTNPDGSLIGGGTGNITDGVDTAIKATVKDLTNSNPLATQIMDANGDAITSFGGGTQYTEDDAAAANPVGTAPMLVRSDTPTGAVTTDGDNVAQRGTNYGAAYTQIVTSTGAFVDTFGGGTQYTEGDVDASITGTAALVEGAGNALAPLTQPLTDTQLRATAVPVSGTFWQATQPVSATDLDIRNLTNVDVVTAELSAVDNAVLDSIAAKDFATQTTLSTLNAKFVTGTDIGDVTINNAAGASAVNIQDGGNSITVDGAVTVSGTATVSATDLDIRNLAPATDTVAIGDGTSTATVRNLASNDALNVAITDGSGNQITSFGGGTQYTEGDTDASITGTALMMEGAANALVAAPGTAADGLLVNLGSNNDVTVTGSVTANAGTNLNTSALALDTTLTDKSQFTKLTDGTDTALVTTAGELNVKQSDVTATGNLTATSQAVTATLDGHGSVTFQITGTFVGTVIPEVSVDGTNWTTAYCYRVADGTNIQVGSFTESNVNEIWFYNTGGCSKFRLRCSAYTSGTITPFIRGSQTAAQSHVEAYITNADGMLVDATGSTVQISDGGGSITVDGMVDVSAVGLDIRNLAPATDTVAIGDGTSTATVRNLAANDALNVAITDGSGNQITSFGGGTQYTEGDTDASITGTALMMEGAGNALVAAPGTAADGLLVNLGTNNDVTVTGTVAVTQSGTWDEVGINDSGNSITVDNPQLSVVGSGTEATAMRVTIATDSTGVLSVDDNGGSLTVDGTVTANLAAGTNNIGDVDVLTLPVAYNAGTTSATTVRTIEATAATSTLSNVAGSASSVTLIAANTARKKVVMYNDSTADCYVKYGSAATSSSFTWLMAAGSHIEETDYNGIITGIWGSATGNMRVTEIST